jgi:16S rRNA processing protein RimM
LTDHPERFAPGAVFLTEEDPARTLEVRSVRGSDADLIVSFTGITDRSAAETLRGQRLTIGKDERRELDEGEYWPDDLEGMIALDPRGERIGVVTGVVLGDAQDRLVIKVDGGTTAEVPLVPEIVSDVHPSGGFVVVDAPEGLL